MEIISAYTGIKDWVAIHSKVKIFPGWWSLIRAQAEPKALFIFGDNLAKVGNKGQANIRGSQML